MLRRIQDLLNTGAGDCLFRSVSHQLYGNSNHHMGIRTAGVQFMRDNPERFIESNTENSWLRYLNNMCIHGTWADALIIQAVADALKVTIQIVESNQGFAPLTTVYPVQERNTSSTITIDHIDECHYVHVSTTALQLNASISMCNELTNDAQSSRNKHFIMSDNNGLTGLHNSHPRVIAGQSFALTSISFKDLPLLYETIGGSLNILLSNGCC